jgi:hypothetical protein
MRVPDIVRPALTAGSEAGSTGPSASPRSFGRAIEARRECLELLYRETYFDAQGMALSASALANLAIAAGVNRLRTSPDVVM